MATHCLKLILMILQDLVNVMSFTRQPLGPIKVTKMVNQVVLQGCECIYTLLDGENPPNTRLVQAERQTSAPRKDINTVHKTHL